MTWKGEALHFATNDPEDVCAGTLEWMDDRVIGLQGLFGDEATYDVVEYYWVPDLWYDQPWCREPAAGCAVGKRVYSENVPHEHELVHAVRRDGLPAVFEEGLAELFSDLGWTAEPSPREDLIDMLEASEIYGLADYSRAAHFMSFLVETHGIEPFLTLAELGDREDAHGKVRQDFEKAFGVSLDQTLIDYEAYPDFPDCNPAVYTDRRIACAEPGIELTPGPGMHAELPLELDCGAEGVLGPLGGYMYIRDDARDHARVQWVARVVLPDRRPDPRDLGAVGALRQPMR